ncbi:MAG: hypothetical protein IT243_02680 [Bacteroidia bacterium]|nr:hypothetical protein [Bacteroidia bacterium]
MNKKSISIIYPRGESLNIFLTLSFIKCLSKYHEINIVVYSKEHLKYFEPSLQCINSVTLIQRRKKVLIIDFCHQLLDLSHNIWINTKSSNDRLYNKRNQAITVLDQIKSSFVIFVSRFFSTKNGLLFLERINEFINLKFNFEEHIEEHYQKYNPTLVFCTSHIHNINSLNWIYGAKRRKFKTAAFIFSWDNLTSQGRIIPKYDFLFTWNNEAKNIILNYYQNMKIDNIFVTGTPQFDSYFTKDKKSLNRVEFCKLYGLNSEKPIFYYTTGMAHHMPGEPIIIKNILEFLEQFPIENRPQLLLRIYPKDFTNRFKPLFGINNLFLQDPCWEQEALLPTPNANFILRESLKNIDLGINIASTITLELLMYNKPVINIAYTPKYNLNDNTEKEIFDLERTIYSKKQLKYIDFADNKKWYSFEHYKQVATSGCVELCYSSHELQYKLFNYKKIKLNQNKIAELFNIKFSDTLDGKSYYRIASKLNEIINKNQF